MLSGIFIKSKCSGETPTPMKSKAMFSGMATSGSKPTLCLSSSLIEEGSKTVAHTKFLTASFIRISCRPKEEEEEEKGGGGERKKKVYVKNL